MCPSNIMEIDMITDALSQLHTCLNTNFISKLLRPFRVILPVLALQDYCAGFEALGVVPLALRDGKAPKVDIK